MPIDCGALVGPLVESELFGHTKGAFTGAAEAKKGLIEVADGGTAFFDEIGDLPLEMQVKLLRLLQEHEFRPVGSLKQHKVNIRVIAATHHDLARDAGAGHFPAGPLLPAEHRQLAPAAAAGSQESIFRS